MSQKHFFLSPGAFAERLGLIGQHLSKRAVIDGELIRPRQERRRVQAAIRTAEPAVRQDIERELEMRGARLS